MSITNCNIINITSGSSSGFIGSSSTNFAFSISSCYVDCNGAFVEATIRSDLGSATTNIDSLFSLSGATGITSANNYFINCYTAKKGAIFSLEDTSFTDTNSTYKNNGALKGGVLYCKNCTISITNSTFEGNWANYGGTIYLDTYDDATLTNLYVVSSYAL